MGTPPSSSGVAPRRARGTTNGIMRRGVRQLGRKRGAAGRHAPAAAGTGRKRGGALKWLPREGAMEVVPLGPGFGAEIRGLGLVDVASSAAAYGAVRAAFEAHS